MPPATGHHHLKKRSAAVRRHVDTNVDTAPIAANLPVKSMEGWGHAIPEGPKNRGPGSWLLFPVVPGSAAAFRHCP
jgi:hypothetical protein